MSVPRTSSKPNGTEKRQMTEGYRHYLMAGLKEGSPREAHLFALAMAHKGVTFGKSIAEIVIELEGSLPAYWPKA